MPFSSQAQRRYMHMKHPDIAKRFEKETPKGAKLPERSGERLSSMYAKMKGKR